MSTLHPPVFNPFANLVDPKSAAEMMHRSGALRDLFAQVHRPLAGGEVRQLSARPGAPLYCVWPPKH